MLTERDTISQPILGPQCYVCRFLDNATDDDRRILQGWLDRGIRGTLIAEWLRQDGVTDIKAHSITRHRRGGCLAGRHAD